MELPAWEIQEWMQYRAIFGFRRDREDVRTALLAERITNEIGMLLAQGAGKKSYKYIGLDKFMPQYFEKEIVVIDKTIDQQKQDWAAFKQKARQIESESGAKIFKKGGD